MTRRACLKLLTLGISFSAMAVDSRGQSCANKKLEVAFVEPSTIGSFSDNAYKRNLVKNTSICSDSVLVHVKDGKHSAQDQLVLRGVLGDRIPPFRCSDLLNCKDPIRLLDIHARLEEQLKGKPLIDSFRDFQQRSGAQTPTLARVGIFRNAPSASTFRMKAAIITAGQDIDVSILFPEGLPPGVSPSLDLCRNAERNDCGETLPKPYILDPANPVQVFWNLPRGLHVIYEAKPLPGDTVPVRTGNTTFVLSAHQSWTPELLDSVMVSWSALLTDPKSTPDELDSYLVWLGRQLSEPAGGRQEP
ncbi:MAG: hypothetical protein IPJ98_16365 [Bryobacterales bacterium]|nr:hypothetical protein [Bryobacterales bacterium]